MSPPLHTWPCTQALDAVQLDLESLAGDCAHINGALACAKAASASMVADTECAARELAASQLRSRLAEQFLQQYQLSPEEVAALQVLPSLPPPTPWAGGDVTCAFTIKNW